MCCTEPQKDLRGGDGAERLWEEVSEMYFFTDTNHAIRQAFREPQGRKSIEGLRPRVSRGGHGHDV